MKGKLAVLAFAGWCFAAGSVCGLYGTRGQQDIYSFNYRGKPGAIVEEDIRWGPDNKFIRLSDDEMIKRGKIITDEGNVITLEEGFLKTSVSIEDYKK